MMTLRIKGVKQFVQGHIAIKEPSQSFQAWSIHSVIKYINQKTHVAYLYLTSLPRFALLGTLHTVRLSWLSQMWLLLSPIYREAHIGSHKAWNFWQFTSTCYKLTGCFTNAWSQMLKKCLLSRLLIIVISKIHSIKNNFSDQYHRQTTGEFIY